MIYKVTYTMHKENSRKSPVHLKFMSDKYSTPEKALAQARATANEKFPGWTFIFRSIISIDWKQELKG